MKANDVYRIIFSSGYEEKARYNHSDLYWCFDNQLIVSVDEKGFLLRDTYWGDSSGKCFCIEDIAKMGQLEFICNLDDIEVISEDVKDYYEKKDVFNLSQHHGYRKRFYVRKGAERSKERMLVVCDDKIDNLRREIESSKRTLEWVVINRSKIFNGNLTIDT